MAAQGQFQLLARRRFGPLFATQFLGAFNDNLFKNALVLWIVATVAAEDSDLTINAAAGIFVLPFFLFSAQAGQWAERVEKSGLIRRVKLFEIAIMALAALAFALASLPLLLAVLFLLGAQSALFGPLKYSILPQHLADSELIGGNGLIEAGTFVAILLGTLGGGLLIVLDGGPAWVSLAVIALAALGYLGARQIPPAAAGDPGLRVGLNPIPETLRIIRIARENDAVFKSILGISWFWMLGATYLTQVPNYTRTTLGGDETVITVLLVVFSVGVGAGSLLCERMSGGSVEIGLVPFGSIGLSVFGFDLYFAASEPHVGPLVDRWGFIADPGNWRALFDLFMLGVFGGFFTVPLYAMIQQRTPDDRRSRVIAANNILNAALMVLAAALGVVLLVGLGLSIPEFLAIMAALNVGVAVYIYLLVPEFLMRFLVWLLTSAVYRIERAGLAHIPDEGPALLVCNHVSYVDALVIAGSCRRPIRFVMDGELFRLPVLNGIAETAGVIPILPKRKDAEVYEQAFRRIAETLGDGELVCIFPEGRLTDTGEMNEFKGGVMRVLTETPVPVVPMALRGLWGSLFTRARTDTKIAWRRLIRQPITLVIGAPIAASRAELEALWATVAGLRAGQG